MSLTRSSRSAATPLLIAAIAGVAVASQSAQVLTQDVAPPEEMSVLDLAVERGERAAERFGYDSFHLVAYTELDVIVSPTPLIGVGRSTGVILATDDVLVPGTYWAPLGVELVNWHDALVTLEPGVFEIIPMQDMPRAGTLGVSCSDGYYACCGDNPRGMPKAKCIKEGDDPPRNDNDYPTECDSGGEGSIECSMPGAHDVVEYTITTHTDVPDLPKQRVNLSY